MYGKIGEDNPFFNKTHTEETRLKISLANKGIAKVRSIKINYVFLKQRYIKLKSLHQRVN